MATLKGVDVSNWQGSDIDWRAAKASGIDFAWAKASEGANYTDRTWPGNRDRALAAGVAIGAYHYAHPGSDPVAQANLFIHLHGDMRQGMLAPALDLEEADGTSKDHIHWWKGVWMTIVEAQLQVVPWLYTYPYFWANAVGCNPACANCARHPLWYAGYGHAMPAVPAPWSRITVWQWAGTSEHIAGVPGLNDANLFMGDAAELQTHIFGAHPDPKPKDEDDDMKDYFIQCDLGILQVRGDRLINISGEGALAIAKAIGAPIIPIPTDDFKRTQDGLDHAVAP